MLPRREGNAAERPGSATVPRMAGSLASSSACSSSRQRRRLSRCAYLAAANDNDDDETIEEWEARPDGSFSQVYHPGVYLQLKSVAVSLEGLAMDGAGGGASSDPVLEQPCQQQPQQQQPPPSPPPRCAVTMDDGLPTRTRASPLAASTPEDACMEARELRRPEQHVPPLKRPKLAGWPYPPSHALQSPAPTGPTEFSCGFGPSSEML